jgi:hypothetical protein
LAFTASKSKKSEYLHTSVNFGRNGFVNWPQIGDGRSASGDLEADLRKGKVSTEQKLEREKGGGSSKIRLSKSINKKKGGS